MKQGTHYSCGCWHEGDYWKHPEFCPTHHQPWKHRFVVIERKEHTIERDAVKETAHGN